jgi:hypothetical protein
MVAEPITSPEAIDVACTVKVGTRVADPKVSADASPAGNRI